MLFIRSFLFSFLFYTTTLVQMVVYAPWYFLTTRKKAWAVPSTWSKVSVWILKVVCGTEFEFRYAERMPKTGYIVAPKHQSAFDTFAFLPWTRHVVLILKRILMWVPGFGWYVARMQMIPIDRGSRDVAIRKVNEGARRAMADNRPLLIYPEGTRRAPGAPPAYKSGIAHLYKELGVPVVVIAHNAGLYWPRNKLARYPGKIIAEVLEPIEPGLSRAEFMDELVRRTEEACDRLLVEAAQSANPPPFPPTAIARLRELGVEPPQS